MNSLSENNNIRIKSTDVRSIGLSNVNEVWTKNSFNNRQLNQKPDLSLKLDTSKMSWVNHDIKMNEVVKEEEKIEVKTEEEEVEKMDVDVKSPTTPDQEASSPSHHARRPMNAFLIFCKKHRPIVRKKYPNLENRGVTRILGEWWALLDTNDKSAYTNLAREYKDAFFNANPNFKWYKLPAPPLRTQPIRPINVKQEPSPPTSPTNLSNQTPEFTPGKLADESQLGMLSSLLSISSTYNNKSDLDGKPSNKHESCNNNNYTENNNEDYMSQFQSPVTCNNQNASLPPKPIKKRVVESYTDNKTITRNIFETESNISEQNMTNEDLNMTNQQIVNKVVASQFLDDSDMKNGYKDTRKSGRKCKGNRYAEFMANGKLLKNKRDKRESTNIETPKLDLNNTIRRLEERIQPKLTNDDANKQERTRTISEISDTDDYSKSIPSFNLSERISELPSLSYESYLQRKKDNKKRKFVKKQPQHKAKSETLSVDTSKNNLTGSKKRKNKHNITHLEKNDNFTNTFNNDLSGLATLAEIAAFKEKITN